MFKNISKKFIAGLFIIAGFSSCKKEESLIALPAPEPGKTPIYIRAIDKDSSVVESQQVLLR